MAQLVLGAAGAVVGGMFGMPQVGWAVGSALGGMLFAPKQPDQYGPRQTDSKVQMSTVGQAIPVIWGRARIAGNVIDGSDLTEHEHVEDVGGGKGGGGPQSHTFTYTADLAIGLCEGEIAGIGRIWQDYKLVYDGGAKTIQEIAGSGIKCAAMRIYLGSQDQMPDPALQALHGELCPAYRGTAYVVFEGLDLTANGGTPPHFEFEIFRSAESGGPRFINGALLKLDQLGAEYYQGAGGFLYDYTTVTGGFGHIEDGVPRIWRNEGGTIRVTAINYNGPVPFVTPTEKTKRSFAIDYNGNFKSSEAKSGDEALLTSFVDTSQEVTQYYQFIGIVRGDPESPVQALAINSRSTRIYGTVSLGLQLFSAPSGPGASMAVNGLAGEYNRRIAGIFLSEDGYSLFMFTAADGAPSIDRWFKLQFTASRAMSVVDQGECDYLGDGSNEPIPGVLISGTGATGYNGGRSGMAENDGVHIWTANDNGVTIFAIRNGKMALFASLGSTEASTLGNSIYVQNGVAFTAGIRSISQYTRHGALDSNTVTLGQIVGDICERCDLAPSEIDVTELTDEVAGFVVGGLMPGRAAIEPLQTGFFFDAVESEGKIKFRNRGSEPALTIPEDDLAAHAGDAGSAEMDTVELTRMQEVELPSETVVTYFSLEGDYAAGSQRGQRQTTHSVNTVRVDLAIAMSDAKAKEVAVVNNLAPWVNRHSVSFSTSRKYIHIEPCDVVRVVKDGQALVVRITSRTEGGDGVISFQGVTEDPDIYTQSATPSRTIATTQTLASPSSTYLQPLDIPALTDIYADGPVLLFAADGYTESWKGAGLFASADGGATYADTGKTFAPGAILGFAMTALPAPATIATFDETGSVDVRLTDLSDTLSSASELAVLNGANAILIGNEILQYKNATQIGAGQFRLTGLLRARRGTEWAAGSHAAAERFVALSPAMLRQLTMSSAQIGKEIAYKAPAFEATLGSSRAVSLTYQAENMRPLAPVYGLAYRDVSPADWHFQWIRRSRAGGEWRDNVDAPLAEASEKYDVEIYTSADYTTLKRTISDLTTAQATYTAAQQVSDFGSAQATVYAKVYQKSELVGRSRALAFRGDWVMPAEPTPQPVEPGSGRSYDLLLKMNGASGSTSFTDDGKYAIAMSASGSVSLNGSGAASFAGGYLSTSDSRVRDIPAGDFCIEGSFATTGTNAYQTLICKKNGNFFAGAWTIMVSDGNGNGRPEIFAADFSGASPFLTSNAAGFNDGKRHRWSLTREGDLFLLRIDGVVRASRTWAGQFAMFNDILTIGNDTVYSGRAFVGTMGDIAISYGSAEYTDAFPMAPELIMAFDGLDGSTEMKDSSINGLSVNRVGSGALSTANSKFGGSSMSFTGGSYLTYAGPELNAGTGDFCHRMWVRLNVLTVNGAASNLFDNMPPGGSAGAAGRFTVGVNSSGQLYSFFNSATHTHPTTFTANAWHFVVLQRKAGAVELYLDGVRAILATGNASNTDNGGFMVGSITENAGDFTMNGFVDDLVSMRCAPFTGDFTPPTSAYPK